MWYMPYMRVRRAVAIYSLVLVALALLAIAIRFWPGTIHMNAAEHAQLGEFRLELGRLIAGAAALAAGLATVLGLNLAAENDGHLEVAWTKPVSREGYALGIFAVDLVAIVACIGVGVVLCAVVVDTFAGRTAVVLGTPQSLLEALAFCGFPVFVYAWIAALSASLKRNRGAVAGLFWPLMVVLALLLFVPIPAIHAVVSALDTFNPIVLYTNHSASSGQASIVTDDAPVARELFGWGVSAVLLAVALAQWRRMET